VAEEFGPVRTELCAVAEAATARTADAPIAKVIRVISLILQIGFQVIAPRTFRDVTNNGGML
jgi:hypothetical protein